jgi:hypothetical protein
MSRQKDYPEDCARIKRLAQTLGYTISLAEASAIWEDYSEDYCAGWLGMHTDSDDHILDVIKSKIKIQANVCPHCGQRIDE